MHERSVPLPWAGVAERVSATDRRPREQQVTAGNATGFPSGAPFGPSGFVVNCPVVSLDVNVNG
jgi:hypothetical protein